MIVQQTTRLVRANKLAFRAEQVGQRDLKSWLLQSGPLPIKVKEA